MGQVEKRCRLEGRGGKGDGGGCRRGGSLRDHHKKEEWTTKRCVERLKIAEDQAEKEERWKQKSLRSKTSKKGEERSKTKALEGEARRRPNCLKRRGRTVRKEGNVLRRKELLVKEKRRTEQGKVCRRP